MIGAERFLFRRAAARRRGSARRGSPSSRKVTPRLADHRLGARLLLVEWGAQSFLGCFQGLTHGNVNAPAAANPGHRDREDIIHQELCEGLGVGVRFAGGGAACWAIAGVALGVDGVLGLELGQSLPLGPRSARISPTVVPIPPTRRSKMTAAADAGPRLRRRNSGGDKPPTAGEASTGSWRSERWMRAMSAAVS